MPSSEAPPSASRLLPDGLVAVSLALAALVARANGLPDDGLWHDDAVAAAGAVHGSMSQLLATGVDHPGFTLWLWLWDRLAGYDAASFAVPALIAGVLGPPVLFVVLRRMGYERSVCALLAAALVVADVHIVYSARVRPYTIDLLVVLGLALVLPRLSRITWSWPSAVAWFAAAIVLSSISVFALIATAGAGALLVLRPASDRVVRLTAVSAHVFVGVSFLRAVQLRYDEGEQAREWQQIWDAFVDFDVNPIRFGDEVLDHLRRVSAVFPGGPVTVGAGVIDLHTGWWSTLFVLVALAGLVAAATRRLDGIRAQYLLLLLFVGLVAGTVDKLPFGPSGTGARASIWLVPALAVGCAAALQVVRRLANRSVWFTVGFDALMYLAAVAVVATSLQSAPPYLHPGSESASEFVGRDLGARDVALVLPGSMYAFALEAPFDVTMRDTPEDGIGFLPAFEDTRVTVLDDHFGVDERSPSLPPFGDVDRVLVFSAWPGPVSPASAALNILAVVLPRHGFVLGRTIAFEDATVFVWSR